MVISAPLRMASLATRIPLVAILCSGLGQSSRSQSIAACESLKMLKEAPGVASRQHNSTPRTSVDNSASKAVHPPLKLHASALRHRMIHRDRSASVRAQAVTQRALADQMGPGQQWARGIIEIAQPPSYTPSCQALESRSLSSHYTLVFLAVYSTTLSPSGTSNRGQNTGLTG